MSLPLSRLDTFRGMLKTVLATPWAPASVMPRADAPMIDGRPLEKTLWDVTAETVDRFGGDSSALPECTVEEARELAIEFPYSSDMIYRGLRPGAYTALRLMRDLSTLTNESAP